MTNKKVSSESSLYAKFGASSSKSGVHSALKNFSKKTNSEKNFFAEVLEDVCGDNNYYSLIHSDGAGTKSVAAYIAYKESGNVEWFKGLAEDSLIMNLDDIACVNAFESCVFSNTIGRNRRLISDEALGAIFSSYQNILSTLENHGIKITSGGGETADMGDAIRTLVLDSCLFARVKKSEAISTDGMKAGDVIVGLSSTGKTTYESKENSGIASNGLTLARKALISSRYSKKYPETSDTELNVSTKQDFDIFDSPEQLNCTIAEAILSPTRTYAPVIKKLVSSLGADKIHSIIHCTGGGQSKIKKFAKNLRVVKNNLFDTPAIFQLIQQQLDIPWEEMYSVFNMGHRMEICCDKKTAEETIKICSTFNLNAQIIGSIENLTDSSNESELVIESKYGVFDYS